MGIYIDYSFYAECPEEELLERLGTLRRGILELPVARVSDVTRVDPVWNPLLIIMLRSQGCPIPPAVEERLDGLPPGGGDTQASLQMSMDLFKALSGELKRVYYEPALEFIRTSDLWNEDDYPEELTLGSLPAALTRAALMPAYPRPAIFLEFASILLRYGFAMYVDPGEGSEPVSILLSTFRAPRTPRWFGGSFTKTQYATEFVKVHETVCRILDLAQEAGLLYEASDTCGYYEHRDWSKSAERVNEETTFARAISELLIGGIEAARKEGAEFEVLSAPALKSFNLIRTDGSSIGDKSQDQPK